MYFIHNIHRITPVFPQGWQKKNNYKKCLCFEVIFINLYLQLFILYIFYTDAQNAKTMFPKVEVKTEIAGNDHKPHYDGAKISLAAIQCCRSSLTYKSIAARASNVSQLAQQRPTEAVFGYGVSSPRRHASLLNWGCLLNTIVIQIVT